MKNEKLGIKDALSLSVGKRMSAGITLTGLIEMTVRDKDGRVKEHREIKNLITNAGFAAVAGLILSDVSVTSYDIIGIGTGTTAANAADTALETEITTGGGERAAATGSRVTTTQTNDTAQLVHTFNFTSTFAVTEAGILNSASTGGDLLAHQVFSAVNVVNGDSLQITWKVQVS